jgi:hypothetical protein
MKITVKDASLPSRPDYPYLAKGLSTGSIWLVTGPRKSILIAPDGVHENSPVGKEWSDGSTSAMLTPFSGTVTLSNN